MAASAATNHIACTGGQRVRPGRPVQRDQLRHRLLRDARLRQRLLLLRRQLQDDAGQPADVPLSGRDQPPPFEKSMHAPPGRQTFGLQ